MIIKAANRQDTKVQASSIEASENGKGGVQLIGMAFIGFAAWLNSFFGFSVNAKEANSLSTLPEEEIFHPPEIADSIFMDSTESENSETPLSKHRNSTDNPIDSDAAEGPLIAVRKQSEALESEIADLYASLNLHSDENQLDDTALSSFDPNQVRNLETGDLSVMEIEKAGMFSMGDFVKSSENDNGLEVFRMRSAGNEMQAFSQIEEGLESDQDLNLSQMSASETKSDHKYDVDLWSAYDFSNF